MKKKTIAVVLALVLVICCAVGGVLAWLTDTTDSITNTFTVGNVKIALTETKGDDNHQFKMVPGRVIEKDPVVTVKADSEACWLFVKVEKSTVLNSYIDYTVDNGWTLLDGVNGVYYKEVDATTAANGAVYSVLTGNQVTVKDAVTQQMMDDLNVTGATQPTLTFTAYAVQAEGFETAADAWTAANFS